MVAAVDIVAMPTILSSRTSARISSVKELGLPASGTVMVQ